MIFHPFAITIPHITYALLGAFIVLFGMFSLFLREKLYIGEAIWAFIFGIIIGPYCAGIFDPRAWSGSAEEVTNVITLEFTRVVLAIGVFAIGVELPKAYMAKHWKSLLFLLVPVMTWGWFVAAGLIFALIPGLNFLSSLAVAACLTPTDPILASAVVGGKWADKHVPTHMRHLLAAESGCNDGAAFPFLFFALYLIIDAPNTGIALRDWFLNLWLYQIILGIAIGSMLGYTFRHLMKFCERRNLIDRHSYVAQYISLAILTIGICTLLGSDDLLAAFCCGTAFAWDGFFNKQTEESVFSSVIDALFNIGAFIFVGAWMPFNKFTDEALTLSVWRLICIAILILLLRRLPIMIALYKFIPDIKTFREAVFAGHFGPIGIGAIFTSTLAMKILQDTGKGEGNHQVELLQETIQPIVAFMVLCSIAVHGLSIPSMSLGRRVHSVSRTWSRRDTLTNAPDWTNQATIVQRREDIVINRDVDLEQGHGSPLEKTSSGGSKTATSRHSLEGEKTSTFDPAFVQSETPQVPDYREQAPHVGPDTEEEWIEGSHRVIEKKKGYGGDVEVTVLDEDSEAPAQTKTKMGSKWHDLEREAEDVGQTVRKEIQSLGRAVREAVSPSRRPSSENLKERRLDMTETQQENSAIGDEDEDEEGWASEGSAHEGDDAPTSGGIMRTPSENRRKLPKSMKTHPHIHIAHSHRRPRRASFRRNSVTSKEGGDIVEESRGREGRPGTSGSVGSTLVGSSSSSRGLHGTTFSAAGSRPGVTSSSRMGSAGYPPRTSRPGTADSMRNNRLESIRAQHRPPTRESSPSRSVRFVDEESPEGSRPGSVHGYQSGTGRILGGDSCGRPLVDDPAEEAGLPLPLNDSNV